MKLRVYLLLICFLFIYQTLFPQDPANPDSLKYKQLVKPDSGVFKDLSQLRSNYLFDANNYYQQLHKQRAFLILMTASSLVLLLIAGFYIKSQGGKLQATQRENNQLENDQEQLRSALDVKNKELVALALEMAAKDNLLDELSRSVQKLADTEAAKADDVHQLSNRLKDGTERKKHWEVFRLRFEEVHQDFFVKLQQSYSSLTPGDLRICALLKLNLSSKDIAEILNISSSSVDMARYRIRKKLNLQRKENLVDFLMRLG